MIPILIIAVVSDLSIDPFNGINRESKIKIVKRTTMWDLILHSFFNPGFSNSNNIPKIIGINEVADPVWCRIKGYAPQKPSVINITLFIRFALCAFIIFFSVKLMNILIIVKFNNMLIIDVDENNDISLFKLGVGVRYNF